ncbi:hypothetical protein HK097_007599 [Rhizophlyctis rosea]|uniref:F-box domain-containing protein n=1 Tax=Rhizophlyctis rosea TaxID=64517 RepID=A0AAD5SS26_9FUNG|nr:hypothetical protein HK097_007599 [Rhizophlyctis rosea]
MRKMEELRAIEEQIKKLQRKRDALLAAPTSASTNVLHNPDLLSRILSFAPIKHVLKCERVCRFWKNTSRNDTSQAWLSKLIRAFPEGCAPPRCGKETWRDVVMLWWAWTAIRKAKTVSMDIPELAKHEALPPPPANTKRQLTFVESHPLSDFDLKRNPTRW